MAIKVNGTTVINDSRALTNIASVDATTVAALGAAGVGGGAVFNGWDPSTSPNATVSSSSTWTKPAGVSDDAFVVFYAVGGGYSGGYYTGSAVRSGGGGGAAAILTGLMSSLPSSISITIGAGGASPASGTGPEEGGDTTLTANGITYTAPKGNFLLSVDTEANSGSPATSLYFIKPQSPFADQADITLSRMTGGQAGRRDNIGGSGLFGAAGGGGGYTNTSAGGTSTYAGNGGAGAPGGGTNGTVPGGGGGGSTGYSNSAGAGAAGNVRIWYIT